MYVCVCVCVCVCWVCTRSTPIAMLMHASHTQAYTHNIHISYIIYY